MTARRMTGCLLVLVALMLHVAPAAGAQATPSATQLFAGVSRLNDELALTGQGAGPLGSAGSSSIAELRFVNHDGYTITVVGFGQTVALSVSHARVLPHREGDGNRKRRKQVSTTTYLAHGKVTPTSISASFADRGRIAVRFRPSGRDVHGGSKAGCKRPSNSTLAHLGIFVGALRFEGEDGYTSADVHRVYGRSIDLTALLACLLGLSPGAHAALPSSGAPLGIRLPGVVAALRRDPPSSPAVPTHPSAGPRSTTLVANSKLPLARVVFAAQTRGKGRARFLAVEEVSEGSIGVIRLAYARGAPSGFLADDSLSGASVSPPRPFVGTASLEHGPQRSKSWSGSLAVSFLGAPHVSLTGAQFGAWLSRGF